MKRLCFTEMIRRLDDYWRRQGCLVVYPWDQPKGAATFSPYTFFWSLDNQPHRGAYLEPCRRPCDARYGDSPNRLGRYYQYQVFIKPIPKNIRDLYERSLSALGINLNDHELRYIEDDWESPTLGASGVGWEVWLDGLEITQFTYFQGFAGVHLDMVPVELTYGLERIAMYIHNVNSVFDIEWEHGVRYRDIFHGQYEKEFSQYHFEYFEPHKGFTLFEDSLKEVDRLLKANLALPAYECVLACSHLFNSLDARGAISVEERNRLIARTREAAKKVAALYLERVDKVDKVDKVDGVGQRANSEVHRG